MTEMLFSCKKKSSCSYCGIRC